MNPSTMERAVRARMSASPGTLSATPLSAGSSRSISSIAGSASGAINSAASSISDTIANMANGLNLGANPMSVLGSDLATLTSQATQSISSIISDVNAGIGSLTSNIASAAKGPQEVADKIKSIAADSAEALATPVAFVTKGISEVVEGVNQLPELVSKGSSWLSDMGKDAISNISKATGINIKDAGSLKDAIKNVTGEISKGINQFEQLKDTVTSTIKSTVDTIKETGSSLVQGVNDTINSVVSGAAGIVNSVTGEGGLISDIIGGIGGLTDSICAGLPPKYADWLSSKSDKFLGKLEDKAIGAVNGSIANIFNKVTGIGLDKDSMGALIDGIYKHGISANGLTTSDGTSMYPQLGDNNATTIKKLYAAAAAICPDIKVPQYVEYDNNKDLFDALLALSAQYGLSDLIAKLQQCLSGNQLYFDKRSVQILLDAMDDVCKQGNPFLFESILDTVKAKHMPKLTEKLKHLGANLADDLGLSSSYEKLCDKVGIKVSELLTYDKLTGQRNIEDDAVYSGNDVVVMCGTSTNVVDKAIGANDRTLIQALMYKYA